MIIGSKLLTQTATILLFVAHKYGKVEKICYFVFGGDKFAWTYFQTSPLPLSGRY
jgi:hypothetical protein